MNIEGFPLVDVRRETFEHQWREKDLQGAHETQADVAFGGDGT